MYEAGSFSTTNEELGECRAGEVISSRVAQHEGQVIAKGGKSSQWLPSNQGTDQWPSMFNGSPNPIDWRWKERPLKLLNLLDTNGDHNSLEKNRGFGEPLKHCRERMKKAVNPLIYGLFFQRGWKGSNLQPSVS